MNFLLLLQNLIFEHAPIIILVGVLFFLWVVWKILNVVEIRIKEKYKNLTLSVLLSLAGNSIRAAIILLVFNMVATLRNLLTRTDYH